MADTTEKKPRNIFSTLGSLFFGVGAVVELSTWLKSQQGMGRLGLPMDVTSGRDPYYANPAEPVRGDQQRASDALRYAARKVLSGSRLYPVSNIDQRVGYIKKRINEGSLDPAIIEAARMIVGGKSRMRNGQMRWTIRPKDYRGEVLAIYNAVQSATSPYAMRYVRDHAKVDQFASAKKSIRLRAGDCDDGTIVLSSLLMAIGYPIRLRIIQDVNSTSWSHIYPLVGLPNGQWVPLDWSMYPFKPAGWEAPGAEQVKRTGKPAGIVTRVRDYEV